MNITKAYDEWEERINKEFKFWFSRAGKELQLCLVAQGYGDRLMGRLMVMFGSGFTAILFIKELEKEVKK